MADNLVRVILDTGRDEGSRVLALVEQDYAELLAWYYQHGTFRAAILALANAAAHRADMTKGTEECARHLAEYDGHMQFFHDLSLGRILILHRTFGRGA